jgi:uncharacterized membrane protein YecN with MAPEG domain
MCNYLYLVTAILLFIFIALSFNAAFTRRKSGLAVGDNETLLRAVRAHGNFTEFTPMFLISLFLIDHILKNCEYILVIGSGFILGRIFHALSMFLKKGILRVAGMMLTFIPLISNFVYLIIKLIK